MLFGIDIIYLLAILFWVLAGIALTFAARWLWPLARKKHWVWALFLSVLAGVGAFAANFLWAIAAIILHEWLSGPLDYDANDNSGAGGIILGFLSGFAPLILTGLILIPGILIQGFRPGKPGLSDE